MNPNHILAVGYLSIDTIETPAGRFDNVPGGAALYAALGARDAGAEVAICAKVGADYPPEWLAMLDAAGIDISRISHLDGPTRRAHLIYSRQGERRSLNHRDQIWYERTAALTPDVECGLEGTIAVVAAPMPIAALARWLDRTDKAGVPVIADTSEAFAGANAGELLALLPRLAAFAPSREETRLLLPELDDDGAALTLAGRGVNVLQKRGADGVFAVRSGSRGGVVLPAMRQAVVDPTGAGDATVGALAAYIAAGRSLIEAAGAALAAGAKAVSGVGPEAFGVFNAPPTAQATA